MSTANIWKFETVPPFVQKEGFGLLQILFGALSVADCLVVPGNLNKILG